MAELKARQAHEDVEHWLDSLDPAEAELKDAGRLRQVIEAKRVLEEARAKQVLARRELQEAVDAARAAGDTWAAIGMALGVSRQAAFDAFGKS